MLIRSRSTLRRSTRAAAMVACLVAALPISAQNPAAPPPTTAAPPAAPAFDPKTLPAVVARVDGIEVSRDDLVREAQGAYQQLRRMGGAPELSAPFFRTALDQRIASILIQSEAQSRGLAATPEEIDDRMTQLRSRFDSDAAFAQGMAAEGLSIEQARAQFALDISRFKYIEKVILPTIEIPDETLRKFYDQNLERMRQPERAKVRHILIGLPPGATEEQRALARSRAEAVLKKAKAGEDFAALAREHSDAKDGDQGGELPWLAREDIRLPEFEQAAFTLEKGAVSDLIESQAGFLIVQAVDRQPSRVAEFDEVKDRIFGVLQGQEAQQRLRQTVDELMAKAKIERFGL